PAATSNASSLPEVGGVAVLYFDPLDVAAIAGALERLLADRALAERLAAAGRARAREFSWGRTARRTTEVYRRPVHAHVGRRGGAFRTFATWRRSGSGCRSRTAGSISSSPAASSKSYRSPSVADSCRSSRG